VRQSQCEDTSIVTVANSGHGKPKPLELLRGKRHLKTSPNLPGNPTDKLVLEKNLSMFFH
jgi:hypothetical protein